MTVLDVKKKIFAFFRPIIEMPDMSKLNKGGKLSEEKLLEAEYKHFFGSDSYSSSNLYEIQINNNLPTESGLI